MGQKLSFGVFLCIMFLFVVGVSVTSCSSVTSNENVQTSNTGGSSGSAQLLKETPTDSTPLPVPSPTIAAQSARQTPTSKTCPATIQVGSQNSAVKTLQERLNALGWRDQHGNALAVDGSFGAGTEYTVKKFQAKYGLLVDGIVGPKTWSALGEC